MTSKELLSDRINSILYWAEELKTMNAEIQEGNATPNYDDISWIANVMQNRGKEIREILKEDEFN
jgi:hypothetical protein